MKPIIIMVISFFISQIVTSTVYHLIKFDYVVTRDGFKPGPFFFDFVFWVAIFGVSFITIEKLTNKKNSEK